MLLDEILDFARANAERPGASLETDTALAAPVAISAAVPPPVTASARVTPQPNRPPSPLTRRESEVAALVARGLTNRQVATELVISEGTVSVHLEHIFSKLGFRSRAQLAVWVVARGI
jgi:non-specific serine/threonine protein kinase